LARSKSRKLKVRVLVTFAPDRGAVLSARETATFVARDGKLS
jgi:hypothetical protein